MNSPEYKALMDRMAELEEQTKDQSYDDLVGVMANRNMRAMMEWGWTHYVPVTSVTLSRAYKGYLGMASASKQAALIASDAPQKAFALNTQTYFIIFAQIHRLSGFDREALIGPGDYIQTDKKTDRPTDR